MDEKNWSLSLITDDECADPAHITRFSLLGSGAEGDEAELYIEVQLNPCLSFWRRCWHGARYILGKRSRFGFGHWDSGGINPESAEKLIALCQEFLRRVAK